MVATKSMPLTAPLTQRALAKRCGVHPSTICLALGNSPAIPASTRQRIQQLAAQLGYRPNAAARNLAMLRTARDGSGQLPLAWINGHAHENFWRCDPVGFRLLQSCRARAAALGYYVDEHWLHQPGMTSRRLTQILRTRGIQGVLLPLDGLATTFDPADWKDFSLIALNGRLHGSGIDEVCPDYYNNLDLALTRLGRDPGQLGLVLPRSFDQASSGLMRARFLHDQHELPMTARTPVCLHADAPEQARREIQSWFDRYQPAVVLGRNLRPDLRPGNAIYCDLQTGIGLADAPGLDERLELVGTAAIDRLTAKIQRFEKGPSDCAQTLLIRGLWRELALIEAA